MGVEPSFSLSYEGNAIDFGYCLANDKAEKVIEASHKEYGFNIVVVVSIIFRFFVDY